MATAIPQNLDHDCVSTVYFMAQLMREHCGFGNPDRDLGIVGKTLFLRN